MGCRGSQHKENKTMSTSSTPGSPEQSPEEAPEKSREEIRLEMLERFDAFNTGSKKEGDRRRDSGNLAATEENKRWERPADAGPGAAGEDDQ
jgi:hypothetical protein